MTQPDPDLRDRIAAAIWERQNPGRRYADCEYRWRADAEADADAVLSVLPAPDQRAAVLLEAADELGRMDYDADSNDYGYDGYRDAWNGGVMDAAALLRRLAGKAQQDEAEADPTERELTADEQVRGVQGWMALDLHQALGRPTDHSADSAYQGHRSWADWWADLLAAVRNAQMIRRYRGETPHAERCTRCTHPKRDHDGRADHRAKYSPLVAGEPWCHACNAECDYSVPARQDPAPAAEEAHPAEHTWAAELYDPLAEEWVPSTRYRVRDRAVNHLEHAKAIGPTWKDGTPTHRRLVRATTTYTVEQPTAPARSGQPETD
ncbi:hypothetical protein ACL07V_37595 [Streptomyces sp. MB22_4]|uniref:hypothetical protein n=1 Tax=Streptomyces sp. MB22_4 TaxID=3383120 RepID=UPI0039A12212